MSMTTAPHRSHAPRIQHIFNDIIILGYMYDTLHGIYYFDPTSMINVLSHRVCVERERHKVTKRERGGEGEGGREGE